MAHILAPLVIKTAIRTVKGEIYSKNIRDLALKDGSFEYIVIADVNLNIERKGKRIYDTKRILVAIRHKDDRRVELLLLKRPSNEKVDMENPLSNCSAETTFKIIQGNTNAKDLAVRIMWDTSDGSSYYQVENINIKSRKRYKRMFNIKIVDTSRWTTKGGWSGWEMTELLNQMVQRRTGCQSVVQQQQQDEQQQLQYQQQPQQHSDKYDSSSFDVPVAEAIPVVLVQDKYDSNSFDVPVAEVIPVVFVHPKSF